MAVRFDLGQLEVAGGAVPIVEGVAHGVNARVIENDTGAAQFAISDVGSLVYVAGGIFPDRQVVPVWVDRQGGAERLAVPERGYFNPRLSADGQRVLLWTQGLDRIVWLYDLPRGTFQPLTFEGQSSRPIWSPDEQWFVYSSTTAGPPNLFRRRVDGGGDAEQLTTSERRQVAASWSSDGRHVAFHQNDPETRADVWVLEVDSNQTRAFVQTPASEREPAFSPDGEWLAYVSDESGRYEVYVQPFSSPGAKVLISTNGGTEPVWAKAGQELFYRNGGEMLAVRVATKPQLAVGRPERLFEGPYAVASQPNYDVTSDGERFLMLQEVGEASAQPPSQLHLVLNWHQELLERVPVP